MGSRWAKWTKFLEKCDLVQYISIFVGPCRGLTHPEGCIRPQENIIWLVETEITFSVEQQYFISTTAGQIHFKSACGFSKKIAQNLEYLAALWSDLDEKLSSWS